jgi:hypothetical protein
MASEAADRVPAVVTRTRGDVKFSEEDKRLIVDEICRYLGRYARGEMPGFASRLSDAVSHN